MGHVKAMITIIYELVKKGCVLNRSESQAKRLQQTIAYLDSESLREKVPMHWNVHQVKFWLKARGPQAAHLGPDGGDSDQAVVPPRLNDPFIMVHLRVSRSPFLLVKRESRT